MSGDLRALAGTLGLTIRGGRALCPACQEGARAGVRGNLSIGADVWFCYHCSQGGGPAGLLYLVRYRKIPAQGERGPEWAPVMADAVEMGLVAGKPEYQGRAAPAAPPLAEVVEAHGGTVEQAPPVPPPEVIDPAWVRSIFAGKEAGWGPLDADPRVWAACQALGWRAPPPFFRLIATDARVPEAHLIGKEQVHPAAMGYRIAAPLFDLAGKPVSFVVRYLPGLDPRRDARMRERRFPKSRSPRGTMPPGLLFADAAGVRWLAGKFSPKVIVVVEGERDLGTAAGLWGAEITREGGALVGVRSGGWTAAHGPKVPAGCRVVLVTDPDPKGDRYAEQIVASVGAEVRCRRVLSTQWYADAGVEWGTPGADGAPPKAPDLSDAVLAGVAPSWIVRPPLTPDAVPEAVDGAVEGAARQWPGVPWVEEGGRLYRERADGGRELVCYHCPRVEELAEDVETGAVHARVGALTAVGHREVWLKASEMAAKNALVRVLADAGIAATDYNGAALVRFVGDDAGVNEAAIPRTRVASRLGWLGGGFLLADRYVAPTGAPGLVLSTRAGAPGARRMSGYAAGSGDLREWLEIMRETRDYPVPAVCALTALASLLIEPLRVPAYTLLLVAPSRKGKTVAILAGMSAVGNPADQDGPLNEVLASVPGAEISAQAANNLPLWFDDLTASGTTAQAAPALMGLVNATARAIYRGTGGERSAMGWALTVLTSAEGSILGDRPEGGEQRRILEVHEHPWSTLGRRLGRNADPPTGLFDSIKPRLLRCYGHAVEAVARAVQRSAAKTLRARWRVVKDVWARRLAGHPLASDYGGYLALMHLAGDLLAGEAKALGVEAPWDVPAVLGWLSGSLCDHATETTGDAAGRDFRRFLEWAHARRHTSGPWFIGGRAGVARHGKLPRGVDAWLGRWDDADATYAPGMLLCTEAAIRTWLDDEVTARHDSVAALVAAWGQLGLLEARTEMRRGAERWARWPIELDSGLHLRGLRIPAHVVTQVLGLDEHVSAAPPVPEHVPDPDDYGWADEDVDPYPYPDAAF